MIRTKNTFECVNEIFGTCRLPGRVSSEIAAKLLGFAVHDVAILVAAKLLKPLGNPSQNAAKYFATVDLQACAGDRLWLDKATKAVSKNWQTKNQNRKRQLAASADVLNSEESATVEPRD
jgi:hypothetical protein